LLLHSVAQTILFITQSVNMLSLLAKITKQFVELYYTDTSA